MNKKATPKTEVLEAGQYEPKATLTADLSDKQVVEEQTTQALAAQNTTEEYLAVLKDRYSSITIRDIHDEEGYRNAKEAKKVLQTTRTTTQKICKAGREEAIKIQKEWIAREKTILEPITLLEDPISKRIEEIDTEIENIHKEEEAQKKLPFRIETIKKTLGEDFVINEEIVKALSDLEFSEYIVNERTLAVERKEKAIKDAEEAAAQKLRDDKIREDALAEQGKSHRRQLLTTLGFQNDDGLFSIKIGEEVIYGPTENVLQALDESTLAGIITDLHDKIAKAREAKATADAAAAAQKIFDDAETDRKNKEAQEELAKAQAQAATPDKDKLIAFVEGLNNIPYPIVSSPEAQAVVDRATFCVDAMQKDLMARINLLK